MRHLLDHSMYVPCAGCEGLVGRDAAGAMLTFGTGCDDAAYWHHRCYLSARAQADASLPADHAAWGSPLWHKRTRRERR